MSSAPDFIYPKNGLPKPDPDVQNSRVKINTAKVKSMDDLTHDTIKLVLECDKNSSPLSGKAGQFATIKVEGVRKPRAYSLAKSPKNEKPNEHTFFIRKVPGGELSSWLEKNHVGEEVTISGPLGYFGLDNSNDTMVCIAGGSGMSAVNAIVEEAVALGVERDCYFFYGARTKDDLYLIDEMNEIKSSWNKKYKFEFIPVLSEEPDDSGWDGGRGFVTDYFRDNYLNNGIVDKNSCKAFFCGPPPMIDAGVKVLIDAGVSESSMFFDRFEDARSPAPVIDNSRCVLCDECLLVKPTHNCIVEAASLSNKKENGRYANIQRVDPSMTSGLYYNTLYIDEDECIRCYACVHACPAGAISPQHSLEPVTLRKTTS